MRPHLIEARNVYLGSLLAFACGTPAWFILAMWTGGDVARAVGIAACVWFGVTTWIVVMYTLESQAAIGRLFSARRRRRALLAAEFADDQAEPTSVH